MAHEQAKYAQRVHGIRAKLYNQKRFKEKIQMKKTYVLAVVLVCCELGRSA